MLSKRLQEIYNLIPSCQIVADIGTDHGFIPEKLLLEKKCQKVIASDISKQSLSKTIEVRDKNNFGQNLLCVVSDGFKNFSENTKIDCVVIAGMGGNEIVKILKEKPTSIVVDQFILQPNQHHNNLRDYLLSQNYIIEKDYVLQDKEKFYYLIKCKKVTNLIDKTDLKNNFNANKEYSLEQIFFGITSKKDSDINEYKSYLMEIKNKFLQRKKYLSDIELQKLELCSKILTDKNL